jgi:hypothetical protein
MTVDEIREKIQEQVSRLGYFYISYQLPKTVGQIAHLAWGMPEAGNCVIIAEVSREEYTEAIGRPPEYARYFYRAMID